ncbi:PIN domain-containing protein [Mucilaginibacter sp. McL0603]|uniref:PIN domain-containing protein n=1 Tax=Mucilaginibacter sp. McL0603 TaxID=3415670 RepID=UPI003CEA878C
MKALLDTNIVIHREASRVVNQDIGILFKWLDKAHFQKCIHPITLQEISKNPNKVIVESFTIKLDSYEVLQTTAPMTNEVAVISQKYDVYPNDFNDSILLNEVYCERVDLLISEDKKIHFKANELGIQDKVFKINSFLEKVTAEYPELVDYKVLSVRQQLFANINLNDPFFDSLKEDYVGFERWFNKKFNDKAYITINKDNGHLLSFLFLKREDENEVYSDIEPIFKPKKRLKVGTFKVVGNGFRIGERFLKIIFDNALANKVEEIYLTIFNKRDEQLRLIELLEIWGFQYWGQKENDECVYVRNFERKFDIKNPRLTYPYLSTNNKIFLVPIYPEYHTDLFPDSILRTESPLDFIENEPHRNAIIKVYVSRSWERNIHKGDTLVFYRTGGIYKGVISTICIAEEVIQNFKDEDDFVNICKKRSVYSEKSLRNQWRYSSTSKPFIVSMLYVYSFPKRSNLKTLIENDVIASIEDVPRGFKQITTEQFKTIIKLTDTNASFIID